MVISSLIVEAKPKDVESVAEALRGMDGVEVHGVEGTAGKIVVTIEADSTSESHSIASEFVGIPGVLNVNLVYYNFEDEAAARLAEKHASPVNSEVSYE